MIIWPAYADRSIVASPAASAVYEAIVVQVVPPSGETATVAESVVRWLK